MIIIITLLWLYTPINEVTTLYNIVSTEEQFVRKYTHKKGNTVDTYIPLYKQTINKQRKTTALDRQKHST